MLKVLIDFFSTNGQAFLQAPLAFLVAAIIGFVIGLAFQKSQNDSSKAQISVVEAEKSLLRQSLQYKDEELERKDE